jgi:hypothetical protein
MSERPEMTTERFPECLDRWGSDLESWPETDRQAAKRLLGTSERARELVAEASDLDHWLSSITKHRAPPGLEQRILNRLPAQEFGQHVLDWFAAALWRPTMAAACALLVGFAIGIVSPTNDDHIVADDLNMLAFSAPYEEIDDGQQ